MRGDDSYISLMDLGCPFGTIHKNVACGQPTHGHHIYDESGNYYVTFLFHVHAPSRGKKEAN